MMRNSQVLDGAIEETSSQEVMAPRSAEIQTLKTGLGVPLLRSPSLPNGHLPPTSLPVALPLLGFLSWCVCFQMGFWKEPAGVWLAMGPI